MFYNEYKDPSDRKEIEKTRALNLENISNTNDMTAENTLILGILAESPYAEFMGDINNPFCRNHTFIREGCLFNLHLNAYIRGQQKYNLNIDYEPSSYDIINTVRKKDKNIPLVSVLLSGRPMVINTTLEVSQAFVAAWLPGTAGGEAIVSAINGTYLFNNQANYTANTLPVAWISTEDSLVDYPVYNTGAVPSIKDPLFPIGYGLKT